MTHSDNMNKSNWLGSVKSTNNVVRVKKKQSYNLEIAPYYFDNISSRRASLYYMDCCFYVIK